MQIQQTPTLEMAARFINSTNSFLPEREPAGTFSETTKLYTKHTLSRIHTLNSQRKKVLRATDFRMRSAKGNFFQSFGGTQLLLIGDLYQLPPIVKEDEWQLLQERIAKGSQYYTLFMKENLKLLLFHLDEVMHQIELWEMAEKAVEENTVFHSGKPGRKRRKGAKGAKSGKETKSGKDTKSARSLNPERAAKPEKAPKPEKGETYRITYALIKEGKTIQEISAKRDLAASTIEAHVVKGIGDGDLNISDVLQKKIVDEVARLMKESPGSISHIYKAQNGKYTFGELRMVQAHLQGKVKSGNLDK